MHLQTTGFVSRHAGSVASANAVILAGLLAKGHRATFYTKPSFVDPRSDIRDANLRELLEVVDCTNTLSDGIWRACGGHNRGLIRLTLGIFNAWCYNRGLVKAMRRAQVGDIDLWLGDWSHGRGTRPVVSFVQGPPGTDAESIPKHRELIERLAGKAAYLKLRAFAAWKLGPGMPDFQYGDAVIVGSEWSRQRLITRHGLAADKVTAIPYPIDLQSFTPAATPRNPRGRLRLLWLGRFVPRKRLDLLLDGLEFAIREGCDAELWVVGKSDFVPNFERLLGEFAYPERLRHWNSLPREQVPGLLADIDVLVQPSEDENFGSSVAEALACGIPAIVGPTNGTGDYLCGRSIRMNDYLVHTMSDAIAIMADKKHRGELEDRLPSRLAAEKHFAAEHACRRVEEVINLVAKTDPCHPLTS